MTRRSEICRCAGDRISLNYCKKIKDPQDYASVPGVNFSSSWRQGGDEEPTFPPGKSCKKDLKRKSATFSSEIWKGWARLNRESAGTEKLTWDSSKAPTDTAPPRIGVWGVAKRGGSQDCGASPYGIFLPPCTAGEGAERKAASAAENSSASGAAEVFGPEWYAAAAAA